MTSIYQKIAFASVSAVLISAVIEANPSRANAFTLTPTDSTLTPTQMTGLRSFDMGANVLILYFDAVKSGTEDRTIAHFDISPLSGTTPIDAILNIPIENIDPEPPGGTFEVYSFGGDGIVSTDEWNSGTMFHTFTGVAGNFQTLSVNVTSLLQEALDNNEAFLSFNFRGGSGTDRYWLSEIANLPDPTLSVQSVPEPLTLLSSGVALGLGVLLKREYSKRLRTTKSLDCKNRLKQIPQGNHTQVISLG